MKKLALKNKHLIHPILIQNATLVDYCLEDNNHYVTLKIGEQTIINISEPMYSDLTVLEMETTYTLIRAIKNKYGEAYTLTLGSIEKPFITTSLNIGGLTNVFGFIALGTKDGQGRYVYLELCSIFEEGDEING